MSILMHTNSDSEIWTLCTSLGLSPHLVGKAERKNVWAMSMNYLRTKAEFVGAPQIPIFSNNRQSDKAMLNRFSSRSGLFNNTNDMRLA